MSSEIESTERTSNVVPDLNTNLSRIQKWSVIILITGLTFCIIFASLRNCMGLAFLMYPLSDKPYLKIEAWAHIAYLVLLLMALFFFGDAIRRIHL
jgi:hypothetical protein